MPESEAPCWREMPESETSVAGKLQESESLLEEGCLKAIVFVVVGGKVPESETSVGGKVPESGTSFVGERVLGSETSCWRKGTGKRDLFC